MSTQTQTQKQTIQADIEIEKKDTSFSISLYDNVDGLVVCTTIPDIKDWLNKLDAYTKALRYNAKRAQQLGAELLTPEDYDALIRDTIRILSLLLLAKYENME